MRDTSLADWLAEGDDDLPPDLPPGREPALDAGQSPAQGPPRRRLWLVATSAWALVAALAVTLLTGTEGEGEPAAVGEGLSPADLVPAGQVGAAGGADVTGGTGTMSQSVPGAPPAGTAARVATGAIDATLATAAALTVRLTHSTYDEGTGTSQYVDLALPAGVTWLGDLAVVTVDAVVLDGDGEGWQPPRAVRYVQPMRLGDHGPVPAGRAWTVPASTLGSGGATPAPPGTEPVDDPQTVEAAGAALAAAGYDVTDIRDVARAGEAATFLVVTVEGRAPGESRPGLHTVWLAPEAEPRVLGTETSDHARQEREAGS